MQQLARVGDQGQGQRHHGGQQQTGPAQQAAPGHRPRVRGGLAQCLGGSGAAGPPGRGDHTEHCDEQTCPKGHEVRPLGVADGEPARCEADVDRPLRERWGPVRSSHTAGGRGEYAHQQCLRAHRPADLAWRGSRSTQQAELPAPLGDREGEGGRHHEHRHKGGDAAGGPEQGVQCGERLPVAVRVGVGEMAGVAGQDVDGLALCCFSYVGRVCLHHELRALRGQRSGAGIGVEDGVLETERGDGADDRHRAVAGVQPLSWTRPVGGDDFAGCAGRSARRDLVRGEGGGGPGVTDEAAGAALGVYGEGAVRDDGAQFLQLGHGRFGHRTGVGELACFT